MGAEDSELEDVFFTYRKNGEEEQHLSPEEVVAEADERKKNPYPFIGQNGVPQHYVTRLEPGIYLRPGNLKLKQSEARIKDQQQKLSKENRDPNSYGQLPFRGKRRGSLARVHKLQRTPSPVIQEDATKGLNGDQRMNEKFVEGNQGSMSEATNDLILQTLMTLGSQIQNCSEGFNEIKNRLHHVETSFTQNLNELKLDYEVMPIAHINPKLIEHMI